MKVFYHKHKKTILIIATLVIIGVLIVLSQLPTIKKHRTSLSNIPHRSIAFDRVNRTKTLRVLTHNNSTSYFLYKGRPMGFHYDLVKTLAKEHGWKLEITVEDDLQKAISLLNDEKFDLVAMDITKTKNRKAKFYFTNKIGTTKQVLVQRKKRGREKTDSAKYIKSIDDLNDKKVYIQKGTVFRNNLNHIKDISLTNFEIIEDSVHTMEELVLMVSNGQIDYTVCDKRVAAANATYDSRIDYSLSLSVEQKLAWAVPLGEDSLLLQVNTWLEKFKKSRRFAVLENKYFKTKKSSFYTDKTNLPIRGGKLSPYDNLIKKYADKIDWDWRLLAAVIYHESRFNPNANSWAGAQGLMQLMPSPAKKFGANNPLDPEQNIAAGSKYLKYLENKFDSTTISKKDRIKFALAAYNAGLGHVLDARKLAEKNNKNSNSWTNNVDTFIVLKSNPKYYKDPVVKYGYCRGKQTYKYVEDIFYLYGNYLNLVE
jgi:membrane-bound lytic murein transglycosylase F